MKNEMKHNLRQLAQAASAYWEVPMDQLQSASRKQSLAWPRWVCMYLAIDAGYRRVDIGNWWRRDHSTVTYGNKKVTEAIQLYPADRQDILDFVDFWRDSLR